MISVGVPASRLRLALELLLAFPQFVVDVFQPLEQCVSRLVLVDAVAVFLHGCYLWPPPTRYPEGIKRCVMVSTRRGSPQKVSPYLDWRGSKRRSSKSRASSPLGIGDYNVMTLYATPNQRSRGSSKSRKKHRATCTTGGTGRCHGHQF